MENQEFIEEKARLHQELNSIDDGATMIDDKELWDSTEPAIAGGLTSSNNGLFTFNHNL